MKVLLLGATGAIGRRTAAELARSPEVESLVVGARDETRAHRVAAFLGGAPRNVTPAILDVLDQRSLGQAMRAADVTVSCAGPGYAVEKACVEAAIDARARYISLCDDHAAVEEVLSRDEVARAAGATIVSGCGASPGLTNLIVALGSEEMETLHQIDISMAPSSRDSEGRATDLHFLHMLGGDAPFVSDGSLSRARAGTVAKPVFFPEPVGWVETFRCGHPEVLTLARSHPGLGAVSFRLGLTERAVMDAARALSAVGLAATERGRRLALRLTSPFRPALERIPPRGPEWTGIRVDVQGESDGRNQTVTLGVVDHLANLATVVLSAAAVALGNASKPPLGVYAPEAVFDVRDLLSKITARGIRVARLEPYPV